MDYNLFKRHLLSYANEDNFFLVFKIQKEIMPLRIIKWHLLKGHLTVYFINDITQHLATH